VVVCACATAWFHQEYFCCFDSVEGLVYPDLARWVVKELPEHVRPEDRGWRIAARTGSAPLPADYDRGCKRVGGTDFGFRNPVAAVWGLVDRDDVLWLVGEHYACMKPLSHHMQYLQPELEKLPRIEQRLLHGAGRFHLNISPG
jgi:hypothetical protein